MKCQLASEAYDLYSEYEPTGTFFRSSPQTPNGQASPPTPSGTRPSAHVPIRADRSVGQITGMHLFPFGAQRCGRRATSFPLGKGRGIIEREAMHFEKFLTARRKGPIGAVFFWQIASRVLLKFFLAIRKPCRHIAWYIVVQGPAGGAWTSVLPPGRAARWPLPALYGAFAAAALKLPGVQGDPWLFVCCLVR